MGCAVANNKPLQKLRIDLGIPTQCHSSRGDCKMSLERKDLQEGEGLIMGGPGAAIGYCQGLFTK
jgi:hypothetical protein